MRIDISVVIALLLAAATSGSHYDFTCINTNPLFQPRSGINIVAVGLSDRPVEIRRYQPTTTYDSCHSMPTTFEERRAENVTVRSLEYDGDDDVRTGVFSCKSFAGDVPVTIPVFSHIKTTAVLSEKYVTLTVNKGDKSSQVVERSAGFKKGKFVWTRSGLDKKLKKQKNKVKYSIKKTDESDEGIYEVYKSKTSEHAVMRLIVRKCPANTWGNGCKGTCRCHNGGVCCADDGECICPPGFTGEHCEVVHESNCFGRDCQYLCSDSEFDALGFSATCEGHLFCLPDPYGCSCYPGYSGIGCDIECPEGTFGRDCDQECHCASGGRCESSKGICSPAGCKKGWKGTNCNEPK